MYTHQAINSDYSQSMRLPGFSLSVISMMFDCVQAFLLKLGKATDFF